MLFPHTHINRSHRRSHIHARFEQIFQEVEDFLQKCTLDEMCNFWNALEDLRRLHQEPSEEQLVPQFLAVRRKKRDFERILEVLADLPYPQMHLSTKITTHLDGEAAINAEGDPIPPFPTKFQHTKLKKFINSPPASIFPLTQKSQLFKVN